MILMNNNTTLQLHLPAEWEYDSTIMLAWPHEETDWAHMLPQVRTCYSNLIQAITSVGQNVILVGPGLDRLPDELTHLDSSRIFTFNCPTNDTWTRDYGPITLIDNNGTAIVADFRFNGWGLKFAADLDNCVTPAMCAKGLITVPRQNCQGFVLEGGGIESDGRGTLLTTAHCQFSPNRNPHLSKEQIEEHLCRFFGAKRVLWLNHGYLAGDDTDSHIDTLARFAPNDTIIYTGCNDPEDEHYQALQAMKQELMAMTTADGLPYNLIELPLPDPVFDGDERIPATYANFLATPKAVFMPTYNQPQKDQLAYQMLQIAFSQPIITVDCSALIRQHGSLHCATMQLPDNILCL